MKYALYLDREGINSINKNTTISADVYSKLPPEQRLALRLLCPRCQQEVVFRQGPRTRAHFAHQKRADQATKHQGESSLHMQSKLAIAKQLMAECMPVQMEKICADGKRRADVYLEFQDTAYTIEIQYAPISEMAVQARENDYANQDIRVIWLLGRKSRHYRYKNGKHFSNLLITFLQWHPKVGLFLPYWNEGSQKVLLVFLDYYGQSRGQCQLSIQEYLCLWRALDGLALRANKQIASPQIKKSKYTQSANGRFLQAYLRQDNHLPLLEALYLHGKNLVTMAHDCLSYQQKCIFSSCYDWEVLVYLKLVDPHLDRFGLKTYLDYLKAKDVLVVTSQLSTFIVQQWLGHLIADFRKHLSLPS
ncbi:competence protein CoiA [Aerococcus kribbianus]|uniref:Competence protein CoiA family protein n=1 Tax=Aerococcus kribbianus TaxID=2999064 RepID=A0A9X3FNN1_9LACT|nr:MULTISPECIES: competence protein CoiA family protein [unclassified Aerococcus]MCZ0717745.1 competence protein CoiA family protein [Aerococcus sp. YH-aer221]MCZ0726033.1 competence protein CoiA family protein [Aerococcus sp. YH-aer222]